MKEKFIFKPEISAEKKEELKIVENFIKELSENSSLLGAGRAAFVKKFKDETFGAQKICIKYFKKDADLSFSNTLENEMTLQGKALAAGVKVPEPWLLYRDESGGEFLVMETIDGYSIDDVLTGRAPLPPEVLDYKSPFWDKAKALVEKMHEAKIFHRDIHEGNIMVDRQTNEPVIIDFGSSTESMLASEDPYKQESLVRPGEEIRFTDDFVGLRNVKLAVAKHLQNK